MHAHGARVILRACAVSNWSTGFQMAGMNRDLHPEVETLFLTPASDLHLHPRDDRAGNRPIGGDVSMFVHAAVDRRLKAKAAGLARSGRRRWR